MIEDTCENLEWSHFEYLFSLRLVDVLTAGTAASISIYT